MTTNDVILVALIVVLIILVAYQSIGATKSKSHAESRHHNTSDSRYRPPDTGYYSAQQRRAMQQQAVRQQAVRQQAMRQQGDLRPEQIAEAEREQWLAATDADHTGSFNPELSQDMQTDTMQYHTAQPNIDYSGYITDLVADPRTRENHQRWAEEMKPWSGTAMTVDNMDEAMEAGVDFVGLRRPQGVQQNNPHQLTERDSNTFAGNAKFNFKG